MISYIKGELAQIQKDKMVVDVGNIGYEVFLPTSTIETLPPIGSDITVHTYMHIRQDIMALYGFLDLDDLDVFRLLITVNGIGPKAALGILSGLTADELRFAVISNDIPTIIKAPGVGKKTASKIVLELKDKFELSATFDNKLEKQGMKSQEKNRIMELKDETVQALIVLGYSASEATKQVNKIDINEDMTPEEILKLTLKRF